MRWIKQLSEISAYLTAGRSEAEIMQGCIFLHSLANRNKSGGVPRWRAAVRASMSRINSLRLMTRVAQMYYVENLNQSEISAQTHISQATISRLLKKAHKEGIVKFAINVPRGIYPEIETELRSRFGIPEVIVTECGADHEDSILTSIGEAAAHYLENTLGPGEIIGISSWSASLLRM